MGAKLAVSINKYLPLLFPLIPCTVGSIESKSVSPAQPHLQDQLAVAELWNSRSGGETTSHCQITSV